MRLRRVGVALVLVCMLAATGRAMPPEERREYRERLLSILPDSPEFTAWIAETDELPPDFDAMPRRNLLPDPLTFQDGRPVRTGEDWAARRAEIRELFEHYVWGTLPPDPEVVSVEAEETDHDGYIRREVVLHYGPQGQATMHLSMVIPDGAGPMPTLIGPGLVGGFGNAAETLLRRGYVAVGFAGSDFNDDTADLPALYPEYGFAKLPRRAWAIKAVLDYLETVPQVDMDRVAVYGYSRDGKMATIAAAIDERIDGVLAGSTGVGGTLPFRLAGERNHGESIESTTRMFPDWFHPRLRFFSGRDDRLPVDGNLLVALVAPRACLIHFNRNDEVGNTFGNEIAFRDAQRLYDWLGEPEKVGMLRRPGFHSSGMNFDAGLDFLDIAFGRSDAAWDNDPLFEWDWAQWRERHGNAVDVASLPDRTGQKLLDGIDTTEAWERKAEQVREAVRSIIGEAPPKMELVERQGFSGLRRGNDNSGPNPGQLSPDVDAWVIQRGSGAFGWTHEFNALAEARTIRFGDVSGELYVPAGTPEDAKLPAVIFLHSYSYPLGYMWVYRRDMHPVLALADAGYAVLAFDQAGFGSRMDEWAPFYHRYPQWSRMGKMVEDVSAAVDALQADAQVDPDRIYLFGYAMGGSVALHSAALDRDIAGVVSIAGFTPMRTNTMETGTGGLARNSRFHNLVPRLGLFVGHEGKVPYDYDELIAAIAPRPVLVVNPQLARDAIPADVREAVEAARQVYALYGAEDRLRLDEPWDYTRLPTPTQDEAIAWLKQVSDND